MLGGNMSSQEFALYEELLYNMLEHVSRPRLMVYPDITTDNATARIKERGRDFEQIVPRDYWEALNQHYNAYFKHYNFSELLTIDANNLDWRKSKEDLCYVINLIDSKLGVVKTQ